VEIREVVSSSGLTVHWSGRVDAAGLARRAFASMRSSQGNTAVVRPLNSVVRRQERRTPTFAEDDDLGRAGFALIS